MVFSLLLLCMLLIYCRSGVEHSGGAETLEMGVLAELIVYKIQRKEISVI